MTTTLKTVLNLGSTGKTVTLSLPDPKEDLTRSEVDTAMDKAFGNNLIVVGGVAASSIKTAYIHKEEDVELE